MPVVVPVRAASVAKSLESTAPMAPEWKSDCDALMTSSLSLMRAALCHAVRESSMALP